MISESLRPSPLPPSRLNLKHWMGILAIISILGGAFAFLDVPVATILFIVGGVAAFCVRRFETSFALIFLLSMSLSYNLILDLRPNISGLSIPLNALDFFTFFVLLSILLNLVGRNESLSLPRHIRTPYAVFTLICIFALIYGLMANRGSMYTYSRDARLLFSLQISLLGVAWFFRSPRSLRLVASVLVLSAVVCAGQQLSRLVTHGNMGFGGIRDVTLPIQTLPISICFLLLYRYHGLRLLPRNTFPFIMAMFLLAILVSFTRTAWAMLILSYVICIQFMGAKQRARSILIAMGVFVLFLFVIPFLLDLASHGMNIQSLMEERFKHIVGQNDLARRARVVSSIDAWWDYLKSPIWGLGIGYPIYVYDVERGSTVEDLMLHNSPLYWGIKLGAIGLFAMLWLLFASSRRLYKLASAPQPPDATEADREVRAFSQALLASFIPFFVICIWSAGLNHIAFMPWIGLFMGLNWDRITGGSKDSQMTVQPQDESNEALPVS